MTDPVPFDSEPMSVKDWVITLIILALPLINIVMILVWAFGGTGNINRRNYCRASLLIFAIFLGLAICVSLLTLLVGLVAGSV
jgi:hypothetical protein